MLNSLAIFKGQAYTYIDHPGTPVEMIGSIIYGITFPFVNKYPGGFIQYHLQNPELFLFLSHILLVLSSIFCVCFFFSTANNLFSDQNLLISIAFAVSFYSLTSVSFQTLTQWSHNSFNFPFGTLYLLFLLRIVFKKSGELAPGTLLGLGLVSGVLAATQLYFAVWVISTAITIFVFYYLQNLPHFKAFLASFVVLVSGMIGFAICLIPMAPSIPRFINWVISLIFHQGKYGGGRTGIISLNGIVGNFNNLASNSPVLFITSGLICILSIYLIIQKNHQALRKPGSVAIVIGLNCQAILLFLLILKQPGETYLLSVAATVPVLLLVLAQSFENKNYPWISKIFVVIVLCGFLFNFVQAIHLLDQNIGEIHAFENKIQSTTTEYARLTNRNPENLVILWTYGTYSPCYSLRFANEYAKGLFQEGINKICPNQYQLNIWTEQVDWTGGWVSPKLIKWDFIITRKDMLDNYPFLNSIGDVNEYPESDTCGNLILIRPKLNQSYGN
jgi:hypothetical protein